MSSSLPLALTMGEVAGISAEITIKAWQAGRHEEFCFFVLGTENWLLEAGVSADNIAIIDDPSQAQETFPSAIPLLPLSAEITACGNVPNKDNANLVIESIDKATEFCHQGKARAVVTNPIHKASLIENGFSFSGHTDYLAHLCNMQGSDVVMMLSNDILRTVPMTQHVPLKDVPTNLNGELIKKVARIVGTALQEQFSIKQPRLAVAGLNPHAGEDGNIGTEEQDFMNQAVAELQAEFADSIEITGCLPADSLFAPHMRDSYDVVLCPSHDQALIPIKALDFDNGVNISLGLPIVRTSPDHGSACELKGKGSASPNSLLAALRTAHDLSHDG